MYGFYATYSNMETETRRTQLIEIDVLGVEATEEEIFIDAMRRAYHGRKENETLDCLEYLYS